MATTYEAPAAARAGTGGPLGTPRSSGMVIVLSIVTIGIYALYWIYKSHAEIKDYSGEGVGGPVGLVIGLVVGFVTIFLLPSEVKNMYEREGRTSPVQGTTGLWCLLPFIGGIVWVVKVQGALSDFWTSHGASA